MVTFTVEDENKPDSEHRRALCRVQELADGIRKGRSDADSTLETIIEICEDTVLTARREK
jgi:hypothetical protein